MEVKEFVDRIRKRLEGELGVVKKLTDLAVAGKMRWGANSSDYGPVDDLTAG